MTTISVTEVRARLRAVLDLVKNGDEVVITQNGDPVAVLVHPSRLRARRAGPALDAAAARLERLHAARSRRPARGVGLAPERAQQLVDDVRWDRDEQ